MLLLLLRRLGGTKGRGSKGRTSPKCRRAPKLGRSSKRRAASKGGGTAKGRWLGRRLLLLEGPKTRLGHASPAAEAEAATTRKRTTSWSRRATAKGRGTKTGSSSVAKEARGLPRGSKRARASKHIFARRVGRWLAAQTTQESRATRKQARARSGCLLILGLLTKATRCLRLSKCGSSGLSTKEALSLAAAPEQRSGCLAHSKRRLLPKQRRSSIASRSGGHHVTKRGRRTDGRPW